MISTDDLNAYSVEDFEEFLIDRLTRVFSPNAEERGRAFLPLGAAYWDCSSPSEVLLKLHSRLNQDAKNRLTQAVAMALKNTTPHLFPKDAYASLIYAVADLNLHRLLPTLMNSVRHSSAWLKAHPSLIVPIVSVLKGLSHTTTAYEETVSWLQGEDFQSKYVFEAYQVLLEHQPKDWAESFVHCLKHLMRAQTHRPEAWQANKDWPELLWFELRMRQLVVRHLQKIELDHLNNGLEFLNRKWSIDLVPSHPIGLLVLEMLNAFSAPFELGLKNDIVVLIRKANPLQDDLHMVDVGKLNAIYHLICDNKQLIWSAVDEENQLDPMDEGEAFLKEIVAEFSRKPAVNSSRYQMASAA